MRSANRNHAIVRLKDVAREVGTLMLAFAPLGAGFADAAVRGHARVLRYAAFGVVLLGMALASELRRGRGHR